VAVAGTTVGFPKQTTDCVLAQFGWAAVGHRDDRRLDRCWYRGICGDIPAVKSAVDGQSLNLNEERRSRSQTISKPRSRLFETQTNHPFNCLSGMRLRPWKGWQPMGDSARRRHTTGCINRLIVGSKTFPVFPSRLVELKLTAYSRLKFRG